MPLAHHASPHLLRELARVSREHPLDRKLLLCQAPAQGRELLRAAASAGVPWIGWEVTTLRKLAHDLVTLDLARAGESIADDFDLFSLVDEAIDAVADRGAAGPFGGVAGATGYRDAIRRAIGLLRSAGVRPTDVHRVRRPDDPKLAALAEVAAEFERLLERGRKQDGAGVLLRAIRALEEGRSELPDGRIFLLPGHPLRGVAGRFTRLLLGSERTQVLAADGVLGLAAPRGAVWAAPEEPTGSLSRLHASAPADGGCPRVSLFAAATPMDELREVLRRVVERDIPWDQVEIVSTDPVTYGAALDSLSRRLDIPVTYAEGLDSRRTRVGRAVETYFRWISEGFPADKLRGLLESGDLTPLRNIEGVSGPALARRLRRLRIGWGQDRYLAVIDEALKAASAPPEVSGGRDSEDVAAAREREVRELRALRALLDRILSATPHLPSRTRTRSVRTSPGAVAQGLLAFLEFVPGGDMVENTTRKVVQGRLQRARQALTRETSWESAVAILRSRLETRVAPASDGGVAPWTSTGGCLHLSGIGTGGLCCRPFTFVVGLDASRVAGGTGADPLLTEADRQLLNGASDEAVPPLPTVGERIEEARHALAAMLARLRGAITLSHSAWDMAEERAVSPAPELLQALRLREGDPTLTYEQLRKAMGPLACAVPRGAGLIDEGDVWLAALARGRVLRSGTGVVRSSYPGLHQGLRAKEERARDEVTPYHGRIAPHPELDPRAEDGAVFSATRLETLGACPRRFFYRYILGVSPTRDPEWDPEAWLDALERGSLLHAVYERTLRECRDRGISCADDAFAQRALTILEEEARRTLTRCLPPSQSVFETELAELRDDVLAFVGMIRRDQPSWTELELAFGPGEQEVKIEIGSGTVRVRGAIDRVDEVSPGALRVIDYKTGGADGYKPTRPFKGGRRIQHVLYTLAAERLLESRVEAMEYHFPTRRGETRVVRYGADDLAPGLEVLEALFAIAADGHFVVTDDSSDCKFCDFAPVCRAEADDYGKVSCSVVDWAKNTGMNQPEYARLKWLREIDG